MLDFGVLGYVMRKLDYSPAALDAGPRAGTAGGARAPPEPDHLGRRPAHLLHAPDLAVLLLMSIAAVAVPAMRAIRGAMARRRPAVVAGGG